MMIPSVTSVLIYHIYNISSLTKYLKKHIKCLGIDYLTVDNMEDIYNRYFTPCKRMNVHDKQHLAIRWVSTCWFQISNTRLKKLINYKKLDKVNKEKVKDVLSTHKKELLKLTNSDDVHQMIETKNFDCAALSAIFLSFNEITTSTFELLQIIVLAFYGTNVNKIEMKEDKNVLKVPRKNKRKKSLDMILANKLLKHS